MGERPGGTFGSPAAHRPTLHGRFRRTGSGRPRHDEKGTSLSVLIVTSKAAPEHTGELEAAAQKMFAAIERQAPKGIKYGSCRLADGVTYVAVLEVQDGVENPLPAIPEFQEFQQGLRNWIAEPPSAGPATVIGNYQLFS